ncbi:MAG: FecR family protein [Burkholderiales bacterium]
MKRVLACFALLCGCDPGALDRVVKREDPAEAKVQSVEIVRTTRPTDRHYLLFGRELRIATDSESIAVVRYTNGSVVYVGPNSIFRLGSIFVEIGEAFVKAAATVKEALAVDTANVKAVVSGTEIAVRVRAREDVTVTVLEDRVRCISRRLRWPEFVLQPRETANFVGDKFPVVDRASDSEIAMLKLRLAQLRLIATPLDSRQQGWCCFNGSPLPASAEECESARGRFSLDRDYLDEVCQPGGAASPAKPPSAVEKKQVVEDVVSLNEIFDDVVTYINDSGKALKADNLKAARQELDKARQAFAKAQAPFARLAAKKDRQGLQKIYALAQSMRDIQSQLLALRESMIAQYESRDAAGLRATEPQFKQLANSYNEKKEQINAALNELR